MKIQPGTVDEYDELTIVDTPAWESQTRLRAVRPPSEDVEPETAPILRVAVRTTMLDDELLVVRILRPGAKLPAGAIEAKLVLQKPLPRRR